MKRIILVIFLFFATIVSLNANVVLVNEDFESGIPPGWYYTDGNNDGNVWLVGTSSSFSYYYQPSYSQYVYYDDALAPSDASPGPDTLFSPVITFDSIGPVSHLKVEFDYGIYSNYGNPPIDMSILYRIKVNDQWNEWIVENIWSPNSTGHYTFSPLITSESQAIQFAWVFRDTMGIGNAGVTGFDNFQVYMDKISLHPINITWDDGGDFTPNEEGDGSLSEPVILQFNTINTGDTSSGNVYALFQCNDITGSVCDSIHIINDSINVGNLSTDDSVNINFNVWLPPYSNVDTFQLGFDVYDNGSFIQSIRKTYIVVPQHIDTTPIFTFYDNTDDHYYESPRYNWIEINPNYGGNGQLIDLTASNHNYISLTNNFYYAGAIYDSITVSLHGFVVFGQEDVGFTDNFYSFPLPYAYPMFAPLWDHLDYSGTYGNPDGVYYKVNNDTVIIEWSGIISWHGGNKVSFEILLLYNDIQNPYDNEILVQYHDSLPDQLSLATIVYQDPLGEKGYNLMDKGKLALSVFPIGPGRAIRFIPAQTTPPDFTLLSASWLDNDNNFPDTDGDSNVEYNVRILNTGSPALNVVATISCADDGSGICNFISFLNNSNTFSVINTNQDTALHFYLNLSQNNLEHANFYFNINISWGADSQIIKDTLQIVSGNNIPSGAGYYALQNKDYGYYSMPEISFIEIDPIYGGEGQLLDLTYGSSDDGYGHILLPKSFSYMTSLFSDLWVSTNGWAVFGNEPGQSAFENQDIPHSDGLSSLIAVLWDDLICDNYGTNGGIYYLIDTTNEKVIVEWSKFRGYNSSQDTFSFEFILFYGTTNENDAFTFVYKDSIPLTIINSSTVGIENEYENDGLKVLYNGTYQSGFEPLTGGHFIYFTRNLTEMPEHNINNRGILLHYDFSGKKLFINTDVKDLPYEIKVYNATGRMVEKINLKNERTPFVLDMSGFRRGITLSI